MNSISDNSNAMMIKPIFDKGFVEKAKKIDLKNKDMKVKQTESMSDKEIEHYKEVLEIASDVLFGTELHYEFQVHEKTGTVMSKLVNTESGETIREIPSEKILDMIAGLWEIAGVIIDDHA